MDAESLLISAVLRTGRYAEAVEAGAATRYFHNHRIEWEWIEDYVVEHQETPSKTAFRYAFRDFRVIQEDNVAFAVKELVKAHKQRVTVHLMKDVAERLKAGDPELAISAIQSFALSSDLVERDAGGHDVFAEPERYWRDVAERIERAEEGGSSGISVGFPTIDLKTGGVQPGDLWILAARLGQGKTWMLCRLAAAALMQGKTVQFNSLEQGDKQIAFRIHTILAGMMGVKLLNSSLVTGRGADLMAYKQFLDELPEKVPGKLYICDNTRGKVSPMTIASQIELNKPDVVFVDYLTLMDTGGGNDWLDITRLSANTKLVAQQYQIPIVAAAQVNRDGEKASKMPPSVANLARADAIGQDADCVITMSQWTKRALALSVEKYRHGEDGYKLFSSFFVNEGVMQEISWEELNEIEVEDKEAEED